MASRQLNHWDTAIAVLGGANRVQPSSNNRPESVCVPLLQYDIVLDVTVVNRTTETLQNLCLELATMGDLKLVERPQNYTLGPEASKQIRANIKVGDPIPPLAVCSVQMTIFSRRHRD